RAPAAMTAAQVASSSTSATSGSHHVASPRNIRIGMATGALNGTYDSTVSTVALSLKKITPKYGIIVSIIAGVSTVLTSSSRDTRDALAAYIAASSTNPTRKKPTNHTSGAPSGASTSS